MIPAGIRVSGLNLWYRISARLGVGWNNIHNPSSKLRTCRNEERDRISFPLLANGNEQRFFCLHLGPFSQPMTRGTIWLWGSTG